MLGPDLQCWFVIPAFREQAVIGAVVRDVLATGCPVVVVDDGSPDSTALEALAAGAYVVRHPINLGQGAALETGLRYAISRGAETIVTFDADGQHRTSDAMAMLAELHERGLEIVFGSRFLGVPPKGLSWSRRVTLRLAVMFTRVTTGLRVTDAHCGLRVMTRACAERLQITQNRMAHASEIPAQVSRLGLPYAEYPVEVLYSEYSKAKGQRSINGVVILLDLLMGRSRS
jgi:glycosyltransferase involved in cell wall biosynthesis